MPYCEFIKKNNNFWFIFDLWKARGKGVGPLSNKQQKKQNKKKLYQLTNIFDKYPLMYNLKFLLILFV